MIQSYSPPASESSEHYDCFRSEITGGMRGANSGEIAIEEYENTGLPVPQDSNGACRRAPPEQLSTQESRDRIEADEFRDILKAEIGYSSYIDYLRACDEKRPQLHKIMVEVTSGCRRSLGIEEPSFTILDLSNEDARLRVVSHYEHQSIMRIVKSLRQPPANVAIQILLCGGSLDEQSLDFLGLGLKISPFFFGAFYKICKRSRPLLESSHTRIGSAVATVLRQYNPEKPDPIPIVLIAIPSWGEDLSLSMGIEQGIEDVFQFQNPGVEKNLDTSSLPPSPYGPMQYSGLQWHTSYLQLLNWCLVKGEEQTVDITKLSLKPFLPLLYFNIFAIRNSCERLLRDYQKCRSDAAVHFLPESRHRLRVLVDDSEDDLDYLRRYLSSQISADTLSDPSWLKAEEDLVQIQREARRLEVQVRDFLQLQVGEWALQESKKSIELSSRQIEEGKRVKIITILAFVYVPLNLATSIFGMNLKELNGSGQNLWVFLTIAIITLLTTGASWFLLEEVNKFVKWRRRGHDAFGRYTLTLRVFMLAWLLKKGHMIWIWKSGAWWRILVNSKSPVMSPYLFKG